MEKRNVIWIASYPKSGSTWVNSIVKHASLQKERDPGEMDLHTLSKKGNTPNIFHLVREKYTTYPCSVLKTHYIYQPNAKSHYLKGIQLVNTGFIHIFRNPLDVLLSYINYTRLQYRNVVRRNPSKQKVENYRHSIFIETLGFDRPYEVDEWEKMSLATIPKKNLDYALDNFSDRGLSIPALDSSSGSWIEHFNSWEKAKTDIHGISLRYEDCLENVNEFFQLLDFFKFTQKDISTACKLADSKAKKAREESSSGSIFYNKMKAYYFFEYFSHSAIIRFFSKNERILKNSGYGFLLEKI
jgi:hypothetical protein